MEQSHSHGGFLFKCKLTVALSLFLNGVAASLVSSVVVDPAVTHSAGLQAGLEIDDVSNGWRDHSSSVRHREMPLAYVMSAHVA